ncbi:OmpA family protein [Usitatibacter palustris]|uniref:Peptidoglycan-associated lipoprotein n=1 Tax=Usitatibacter palustris TaxID=2732487 RepID=A0A6M4H2X4_9PROT|nr:OmpA family protein [Usitatibacter palustris]QJR13662.1 Peptidoglycan-associated lipoprotein [Usitatibacter palustris]
MNIPQFLKPAAWIAICAATVAGCASAPVNDALEAARVEVNAAAADPDVLARAPLELREAQGALDAGVNALRDRADREKVNHYAYLAQVRAQTARELARSRRATDDLAKAQSDVDRLRLAARTQEADAARAQAYQQSQAAQAARADAANATQQAANASQQARIASEQAQAATAQANMATQQARDERARADAAAAEAEQARLQARTLIIELQGKETERGLLVTLGDVLFATGEAVLLPNAASRMDKLAAFLNRFPEKTLLIEGYTDSVGGDSFNQGLSERRAESVRVALEARGVNAARMTTRGYGESFPVASNASTEGRSMNRRVEVVVSDESGRLRPRQASLR